MFGTGLGVFFPLLLYIASIAGSLVSVVRPIVGVYILALILPLQAGRFRMLQFPLGGRVMEILMLGVFIGVIIAGGSIFPPKQLRRTVIALCIITFVSLWVGFAVSPSLVPLPLSLSTPNGGHSPLGYWVSFMHLPVLFVLVCATVKDKRQMQILLLVMMLAFLWNAKNFYGNVGHRSTEIFLDALRGGIGQDFGGSNGRAAFGTQCTLFLLGIVGTIKSLRIRLVVIPLIVAGLYSVLFSYSRGAYAAFAIGLLYLAIFRVRLFLLAFLLVPFLGVILPTSVSQRLTMTYEEGKLDTSSSQRVEIWKHAFDTTLKSPVLGVGFDSYRFFRSGEELLDTHNMYVKALVETGIVGLSVLVAFFLGAFFAAHRLSRIAADPFYRALGAGFGAYMLAVMVSNIFGDRWTYIDLSANTWILLGLVVQATRFTQENALGVSAAQLQAPVLRAPMAVRSAG